MKLEESQKFTLMILLIKPLNSTESFGMLLVEPSLLLLVEETVAMPIPEGILLIFQELVLGTIISVQDFDAP